MRGVRVQRERLDDSATGGTRDREANEFGQVRIFGFLLWKE